MSDRISHRDVTIILATIIPSILLIAAAVILCCRSQRRKARLFRRGITPIDDEEIHSWKLGGQRSEKMSEHSESHVLQSSLENYRAHRPSGSLGSVQKPASVIIYQHPSHNTSRVSQDQPLTSSSDSFELPPVPVLARAPNSRPGLTDESVQGEDAFISLPRRSTMRLSKAPPSASRHVRSKSSRATMSPRDAWYGQCPDLLPPRRSADTFIPAPWSSQDFDSMYSSWYTIPRLSVDDEVFIGGLSPRPLIHQSEIGRAIG